jgi:hypothetical protein
MRQGKQMNMICVAAAPGWIVRAKSKEDEDQFRPMSVIAWLLKLDENAGRLVVKPITPWGEPPDDGTWEVFNTEYGDDYTSE